MPTSSLFTVQPNGGQYLGELAAQVLTQALYEGANPDDLQEDQRQTISALSSLVGALAGGIVGGDSGTVFNAAVGGNVATNAVENNWLTRQEFDALKEAEGACGQGNQVACQKAEDLRALDKARDREYAAYATSVLESMKAEGVTPTEEEFSRRVDGYWVTNGVDRRDVVYPEGGHIPAYPTRGEELYAFLGRLAENLPDWYPGKAPAEFSTALMQGLLEQGGEAVAGWVDLFKPGEAVNWFTGDVVSGVDAWEARFGSGAELIAGLLTGGLHNVGDDVLDVGIRWGKGLQDQGMPWENYLASTMSPDARLPAGFRTFDFFDDESGLAISAKTLDTMTLAKLANPKQVYSSLRGNIDAAADYDMPYELSGVRLDPKDIAARELHVAVPTGTTPAQWLEIQRAIEYARARGVIMRVTKVRGGGG